MPQPLSPLRLGVRTVAGQHLGVVVDIEIDPATQSILTFHVKPNRLLPDLVRSPLLIQASQVIEISATGLVVDDSTVVAPSAAPELST